MRKSCHRSLLLWGLGNAAVTLSAQRRPPGLLRLTAHSLPTASLGRTKCRPGVETRVIEGVKRSNHSLRATRPLASTWLSRQRALGLRRHPCPEQHPVTFSAAVGCAVCVAPLLCKCPLLLSVRLVPFFSLFCSGRVWVEVCMHLRGHPWKGKRGSRLLLIFERFGSETSGQ